MILSHPRFKLRPLLKHNLPDDITIEEIPVSTADGITISLSRFRRGNAQRSLLLLHGMTASTDMFTLPEHRNLVSFLVDEGWGDIWSLDWRGSCRLPYNTSSAAYTVDDVALYDLPAAIDTIRDRIGDRPLFVISHCVGAIALGIALSSGLIRGLAGVVANSVFLTTKLPDRAAAKIATPILELIQRWCHLDYIPTDFTKIGFKSTETLLFAMAAATRSQCSNPNCQMISFIWGAGDPTLFRHENLHPDTHDRIADLLGATPLSYFPHFRQMSLAQTTVRWCDTDESYTAITPNGIASAGCLDTPILLISGSDNHCWGDSNQLCAQILQQRYPHLDVTYREIPAYGHIDTFIGRYAALDVFPYLLDWLESL